MTKQPSRILNEPASFLGLTVIDFSGLGYLLIISHTILKDFNLEILSFAFVGILLFSLIGIRAKYRSKTIRDYLSFFISKRIYFKSGAFL